MRRKNSVSMSIEPVTIHTKVFEMVSLLFHTTKFVRIENQYISAKLFTGG